MEPNKWFSARFPSTPEEYKSDGEGPAGPVAIRGASSAGTAAVYLVMAMVMDSHALKSSDVEKELSEVQATFLRQAGLFNVGSIAVGQVARVRLDGCEGLAMTLDVTARGRHVAGGARMYVCADLGIACFALTFHERKGSEKLATAFLDSLRLGAGVYETY